MFRRVVLWSLMFGNYCLYPQWSNVGNKGFSNAVADHLFLQVDKFGQPHVVYRDAINNFKLTCMSFSNNSWVNLGPPGLSTAQVYHPILSFDHFNIPYCVYTNAETFHAESIKYENNSWHYMGEASTGEASYLSSSFTSNNKPIIAFRDFLYGCGGSVLKYEDNSWNYLGNPGFTQTSTAQNQFNGAAELSLAVSPNGQPYVSYLDQPNQYKASVMKFNGSNWEYVGTPGFSAGDANYTKFAFDINGTPYICYTDGAHSNKATVMKYNGSEWITVGNAGFTPGSASFLSLHIDSNNNILVSFKDHSCGGKASVMIFNGTAWAYLGQPGFSDGTVWNVSSALSGDGNLYVAYSDETTMPYQNAATVMVYKNLLEVGIETIKENSQYFSVYPNPTTGKIYIETPTSMQESTTIEITNSLGQTVFEKKIREFERSKCIEISFDNSNKGNLFYLY